jgi:hypothetical protein
MRWSLGLFALLGLSCASPGHVKDYDKSVIDTAYRSEGVAVFDVDLDGNMDIVTEQFWYAGPSFVPHEIRTPEAFDPATSFCSSFAIIGWDVDEDGWEDIVVAPHVNGDPMLWYRNPRGVDVHWESHVLARRGAAGLETPIVVDLFGDERPILISSDSNLGILGWQVPGFDPTQPWPLHPISGENFPGAAMAVHGIGAGDVDGDGRLDVLTGYGWFQATDDHDVWQWHEVPFGPDRCSRMFAIDLDNDGLADIVCSRPHGYGLHWFHQLQPPVIGERKFVERSIDESVSQMHALRVDDLDDDGIPEIVSGKRWWAHGEGTDPGVDDPAVVVSYSIKHTANGPSFERSIIDDDSGVGTQFAIADVDSDGRLDIVTSNKKGLFYFRRR